MKELLNDFDVWTEALKKINLNESALPIYHGHILENQAGLTYQRLNKIVNCSEAEKAHKYCLSLDPEDLEQEDIDKVKKIYDYLVSKGLIDDDIPTGEPEQDVTDYTKDTTTTEVPGEEKPVSDIGFDYQKPIFRPPCFTVMYSAMRDGQIKTGESYSNAISPQAAKADVYAKLSRVGYENISILAIECGDTDSYGYDNSYTPEDDVMNTTVDTTNTNIPDDDNIRIPTNNYYRDDDDDENDEPEFLDETTINDIDECDPLHNRPHLLHTSVNEDDEEKSKDKEDSNGDSDGDENSKKDDNAAKPEFDDMMNIATGNSEELSDKEKAELRDEYSVIFKNTMSKCEFFDKPFNRLTIEEKIKFFEELLKVWDKNEPFEFMTDEEIDQLESIVIPSEDDKNDEGKSNKTEKTSKKSDDSSDEE